MIAAPGARSIGPALVLLVVSTLARAEPGSLKFPDASLEPSAWSRLDGWAADDHAAAFATFLASCKAILAQGKAPPAARRFTDSMKAICRRAKTVDPANGEETRVFFETNFQPLRIAKVGDPAGFLTGYYEPIVAGSRFPTPEYTVPLYRRPGDLRAAGGSKKGIFNNKSKVFRKVGRKLLPYFTRAEIEDGALDGRHLEICWLKDPIDAFFISIQGSARIRLEDGAMLRINYDAHNGHRYLPVGRVLIDRGEVAKEDMSMERIRQWMLAHPEEGRELRRMNNSYVFYRVTDLSDHQEPIGAQGVSLTPVRSIAVDRHLHLYGTPFWIEAELPIESEAPVTKFRRLMVAQDTGSAIVGPARADIYWGAGDEAGAIGGRIKQPGLFTMLAPRDVDPFARWRHVPMPPAKPDVDIAVPEAGPVTQAVPDAQPAQQAATVPVPPPPRKAEPRHAASEAREQTPAPKHARKSAHGRRTPAHHAEEPASGASGWSRLKKFFIRSSRPDAAGTTRGRATRREAVNP